MRFPLCRSDGSAETFVDSEWKVTCACAHVGGGRSKAIVSGWKMQAMLSRCLVLGTECIPPTPTAAPQCMTVIDNVVQTAGPANSLLLVLPRVTQIFHLCFSRCAPAKSICLLLLSFVSRWPCFIMQTRHIIALQLA